MEILDCLIDDTTLNAWKGHLAPKAQPFFLGDDLASRLPAGPDSTREEFRHSKRPLSLHDTFATYEASFAASHVLWLDQNAFCSLATPLQSELLHDQLRLGRGSVFRVTEWAPELKPDEAKRVEEAAADGLFVWWPATFHALSQATHRKVLAKFVGEDRPTCRRRQVTTEQWRWIDRILSGVRTIAGTFLPHSGPNCLATVIEAFESNGLAEERMEREPFEQWLAGRAPRPVDLDEPGDIIIWRDGEGTVQHAAVNLGEGRVFHKESQTWWTPRQVVRLEDALQRWQAVGTRDTVRVLTLMPKLGEV